MAASRIHPILGTMTFGGKAQVKHDEVTVMLRTFCGAGCAKTPSGSSACFMQGEGHFPQTKRKGRVQGDLGCSKLDPFCEMKFG